MPDPANAKIGVCVKGCDSRTLVALLQEELVDKDRLYVIGVPCDGVINRRRDREGVHRRGGRHRLRGRHGDGHHPRGRVQGVRQGRPGLRSLPSPAATPTRVYADDLAADRCRRTRRPRSPCGPRSTSSRPCPRRRRTPSSSEVFETCIRCFACIHACPVCYCWDQCVNRSRTPALVSQRVEPRTTSCSRWSTCSTWPGAARPAAAAIGPARWRSRCYLLHRKMNKELYDMLGFEAGREPRGEAGVPDVQDRRRPGRALERRMAMKFLAQDQLEAFLGHLAAPGAGRGAGAATQTGWCCSVRGSPGTDGGTGRAAGQAVGQGVRVPAVRDLPDVPVHHGGPGRRGRRDARGGRPRRGPRRGEALDLEDRQTANVNAHEVLRSTRSTRLPRRSSSACGPATPAASCRWTTSSAATAASTSTPTTTPSGRPPRSLAVTCAPPRSTCFCTRGGRQPGRHRGRRCPLHPGGGRLHWSRP